jgi:hypothetical protein
MAGLDPATPIAFASGWACALREMAVEALCLSGRGGRVKPGHDTGIAFETSAVLPTCVMLKTAEGPSRSTHRRVPQGRFASFETARCAGLLRMTLVGAWQGQVVAANGGP